MSLLFSAVAVRAASMALAVYVAFTVDDLIARIFDYVDAALAVLP